MAYGTCPFTMQPDKDGKLVIATGCSQACALFNKQAKECAFALAAKALVAIANKEKS